ncbi:MAG TPA: Fe-S cluster assembly protein SufD [Ktedonobacterales bacterium]|jgi:Fe-S cluster assembly protein SufD
MSAPAVRRGFSAEALTDLLARRAARDEPAWMRERRQAAWDTFEAIPMPTRQDEEWRRTDLRGLKLEQVEPFGAAALAEAGATPAAATTLLPPSERGEALAGFLGFRDGALVERQLAADVAAQGVIFTDLATALREHPDLVREHFMTRCVPASDGKFAALHGAFWDSGALLYVPRGVVIEQPFRVIVAAHTPGRASLPHTLVILGEHSQATFVEEVVSANGANGTHEETQRETRQGFSSRVSELFLGPAAHLDYSNVQHWGRSVYDFHTERALLEKDSALVLHSIEFGSQLSKGRVESIMAGPGTNARLIGLYFGDGHQHLDRYTLQDHQAPNATSDLLFKGVLTDQARSVYSGLIRVHPNAQKTDAYQQNRNLLLSRTARADSIPNLEIGANDVRCTHGATVGKVDEDELFYIMCRGLTRADATRLIVEGFVDPQIEALPIPGLRETLRREIERRVGAGAQL